MTQRGQTWPQPHSSSLEPGTRLQARRTCVQRALISRPETLRNARIRTSAFAVRPLTPAISPEYRGEGVISRPGLTQPITAAACGLSLLSSSTCAAQNTWEGVDKTVEKLAEQAGHPAREPYLNTDRGDLLLFLFLLAGAIGGFIAGYAFRSLFPPTKTDNQHHASAP